MDNMPESTAWFKSAVIYQIYPRSFQDTNNDGIGDIRGIIKRLDYLCNLGVDAIWLSPIYPSPMVDFGYDVVDHCDIDPLFGSMEDFDHLLDECHKRDIKLLMDFIPNHTSDKHPWFLESKSSRDNIKRDWYIWREPKENGQAPNNWLSVFGGNAWTLDKETNQYYLHSFFPEQPDLNWRNLEVKKAMTDVLEFWLKKGVDGFRIDSVTLLIKDQYFRDEDNNLSYIKGIDDPYYSIHHDYSRNPAESQHLINYFTKVLEKYPGIFMVTETSTHMHVKELLSLYKASDNNNWTPFNFSFINLPWQKKNFQELLDAYIGSLKTDQLPNFVLGNHDKPRLASRIGKENIGCASVMFFTLPGVLFIYYGEEIGMENTYIPKDKIHDPFEKRVKGLGRDPERTPMQWDKSKNSGFSNVEPWLPINGNFLNTNVELEENKEDSILNIYKKLILLRKRMDVLKIGDYIPFDCQNEAILGYIRKKEDKEILVLINFSNKNQSLTLPDAKLNLIFSTQKNNITGYLQPFEGCIYEILI